MFDFDASKLLIIGVVALVVIGPKDLPRVLRQIGQMVTKVRRMAGEFQGQFMEAMKEADLEDIRAEVAKLKDSTKLDVDFNPARDVKHQLMTAVDGVGAEPAIADTLHADTLHADLAAPRASKSFPMPPVDNSPLPSPGNPSIGSVSPASSPVPDPEPVVPRRKIVVTRRRAPPSRFDGSLGRAAFVQRSRNILPARRGTPDP